YGSAPEGSTPSTLPVLRKPFQLSELEQAMKLLTDA
ncbi:response regulator, partial [Rhizobium phaseoli]